MFRFRFQKALEQKEQEEKEAKNRLFLQREKLESARKNREKIDEEVYQFMQEYSSKKSGKIDIETLRKYEEYLGHLKKEASKAVQKQEEASKAVETAEEEFIEARKEVKMFEKLKEKQYEKYLKEENEKEIKLIDELSNSIYNRRK